MTGSTDWGGVHHLTRHRPTVRRGGGGSASRIDVLRSRPGGPCLLVIAHCTVPDEATPAPRNGIWDPAGIRRGASALEQPAPLSARDTT